MKVGFILGAVEAPAAPRFASVGSPGETRRRVGADAEPMSTRTKPRGGARPRAPELPGVGPNARPVGHGHRKRRPETDRSSRTSRPGAGRPDSLLSITPWSARRFN